MSRFQLEPIKHFSLCSSIVYHVTDYTHNSQQRLERRSLGSRKCTMRITCGVFCKCTYLYFEYPNINFSIHSSTDSRFRLFVERKESNTKEIHWPFYFDLFDWNKERKKAKEIEENSVRQRSGEV